ncbi:hypothetical protein [Streptomyces sp. Isolate_219]|uniref:hypothetical protein n=1 Tax=Streptomyces sp. Isolate_219 TaxID=2950110 RepID=UPI0021CAD460|nr:hypothetical protein [Streptomyces sp. Isolate_219]MCR8576349.1 hypothetical protein [Streptomyces sp. Isolate_219]
MTKAIQPSAGTESGDTTDLIVPIRLHALVSNDMVNSAGGPFSRWRTDYELMLEEGTPPEPPAGQGAEERVPYGVRLQWQFPEALSGGHYDEKTEVTTFPLVPNRWLIVRYFDPKGQPTPTNRNTVNAKGWLVHSDYLESDYPDRDDLAKLKTPRFRDPESAETTFLSLVTDVTDEPWSDPGRREPFLTAVGPGLPAFAAYEPYHEGVFSFHDDLEDLKDGVIDTYPPDNRLSYLAVGWYSEQPADILAQALDIPGLLPPDRTDPEAVLEALGWALPGTVPGTLRNTLYVGTALGVTWKQRNYQPLSDKPDPVNDRLKVAVGHSVGDAAAALTAHQTRAAENGDLLSALYHGTIDSFDAPGGDDELDEALRSSWFAGHEAGYAWRLVERRGDGFGDDTEGSAARRTARATDPQWLVRLNDQQAAYDAELPKLRSLQGRTWALWFLRHRATREGAHAPGFDAAADAQLDPAASPNGKPSMAKLTKAQYEKVAALAAGLPRGDTPEELEAAIADFADRPDVDVPEGMALQREMSENYYTPADPVVVIEGANVTEPLARDTPLPVRPAGDLLRSLKIGGSFENVPANPPSPRLDGFPPLVSSLLAEFALLDKAAWTPAAAPGPTALHNAIAHPDLNVTGSLAQYTAFWKQPWLPMYLQWDVRYVPTPFRTGSTEHWEFDGNTYTWKGSGSTAENASSSLRRIFRGRSFLTPTVRYVVERQLDRYLQTYPDAEAMGVRQLREDAADLDMLSQTLDGFHDWLLTQNGAARPLRSRVPVPSALEPLLGDAASCPAPSGHSDTDPADDTFQPVRAGQFFFYDLRIIDRFGRVVDLTNSAQNNYERFPPIRALSVLPDERKPLYPDPIGPQRFIQLPPRLLQPARVRLSAVHALDGAPLPAAPTAREAGTSATPVAGWLLVNRLDETLMVYAPDGSPLGEMRVLNTTQTIEWNPLPHSPFPDPASPAFTAAYPRLAGFIAGLRGQTSPHLAFAALLDTIDTALDGIVDPSAQDDAVPSRLIGRPVALVAADLTIDLQGLPLADPGWSTAPIPPSDGVVAGTASVDTASGEDYPGRDGYRWPVRLGSAERLTDGLIGYFTSASGPDGAVGYTALFTEQRTREYRHPYLQPIGTGSGLALPATLPGEAAVTHHLSVLMDPHAAVHATTDILPVARLALDADFVHASLAQIRASFRLHPLLAVARPPMSEDEAASARGPGLEEDSIVMPHPAAWHGDWTWAEPRDRAGDAPEWLEFPIAMADTYAYPGEPVAEARAGYLQLKPRD